MPFTISHSISPVNTNFTFCSSLELRIPACACLLEVLETKSRGVHSRPKNRAPTIVTSGRVQHRKSAIHGFRVTLRMLRVKSDKSDWFRSYSIVFAKPIRTGISPDLIRAGCDLGADQKERGLWDILS